MFFVGLILFFLCASFVQGAQEVIAGAESVCAPKKRLNTKEQQSIDRSQELLKILKVKKRVDFSDLQDSLYKKSGKKRFYWDVCFLAHSGVFLEAKGDCVFYRGPALGAKKVKKKRDFRAKVGGTKDVCADPLALRAMFDAVKEGCTEPLAVKLQLLREGYLSETFSSLEHLENILLVGGVYPGVKPVKGRLQYCQSVWEEVYDLPKEGFDEALTSETAFVRRVLFDLRRLEEGGELKALRDLMPDIRDLKYSVDLRRLSPCRRNIIERWSQYAGQDLRIDDLVQKLGVVLRAKNGKGNFVKGMLCLAVDGLNIIYNKDAGTMKLLKEQPEAPFPPEGTTIETMVYDFLCQYKKQISIEELAYYACSLGYCCRGERGALIDNLKRVKQTLAVLEIFNHDIFFGADRCALLRQRGLWRVAVDQGFPEDFDYRNCDVKGCTEDDERVLKDVREFVGSEDHALLQEHIARCAENYRKESPESFVVRLLSQRSYSKEELRQACKSHGILYKDFWLLMGSLTLCEVKGRVMFDFFTDMFFWDSEGVAPTVKSHEYLFELFHLVKDRPDMEVSALTYMMIQQGFVKAYDTLTSRFLRCFEILGVVSGRLSRDDACLQEQRKLLNLMMSEGFVRSENGYITKDWDPEYENVRLAIKTYYWVSEGAVIPLWRAYLDCWTGKDTHCLDAVRRRKRELKCQAKFVSAQEVMREELPKLFELFCQNYIEFACPSQYSQERVSWPVCPARPSRSLPAKEKDYAVDLLIMKSAQPSWGDGPIVRDLRKKGYQKVTLHGMQIALRSFELLGFFPAVSSKEVLFVRRRLVRLLLSDAPTRKVTQARMQLNRYGKKVCRRVFLWVHNTERMIVHLWKVYLYWKERRAEEPVVGGCFAAEDIVFRKLRPLYNFLRQEGAWREDCELPDDDDSDLGESLDEDMDTTLGDCRDETRDALMIEGRDDSESDACESSDCEGSEEGSVQADESVPSWCEKPEELTIAEKEAARVWIEDCKARVGAHKKLILEKWSLHIGETFSFSKLAKAIGVEYRSKTGQVTFLKEVLSLVAYGAPIDYDHRYQLLRLRPRLKGVAVPPEGTSLSTMAYDLLCEYKDILLEELVYYAHHLGYLSVCDDGVGSARILRYKQMFAVLGLIDWKSWSGTFQKKNIERKIRLWDAVKDKEWMPPVGDVESWGTDDVTASERDFCCWMKEYVCSGDYVFLKRHVDSKKGALEKKPYTEYIKEVLLQGPRSCEDLWDLCRRYWDGHKWYFWIAIRKLLEKKGPGCLKYNIAEELFYWDKKSRAPTWRQGSLAPALFCLKREHPELSDDVLGCVLMQKGYKHSCVESVRLCLRGFEVLGLKAVCSEDEKFIADARRVVNMLVQELMSPQGCIEVERRESWKPMRYFKVAQKVLCWVKSGRVISDLLDLSANGDDGAVPPPSKRAKMDDAQAVIKERMPQLYDLLQKRGEWT